MASPNIGTVLSEDISVWITAGSSMQLWFNINLSTSVFRVIILI